MRYVLSHLPMALMYGLLLMLWRGGVWPITTMYILQQGMWLLGVSLGVLLVYLDRIAYIYSFPGEQLSQQVSWYFANKQPGRALALLDSRRYEQVRLTFRSALFIVAWIPLAFFAVTSTNSLFGTGVVMGVMLHILVDTWRMQRKSPELLNTRLFWQIKRKFAIEEQLVFLWVVSAIFIALSLLAR